MAALVGALVYPPAVMPDQPLISVEPPGKHAYSDSKRVAIDFTTKRKWVWLWQVNPYQSDRLGIDVPMLGMEMAILALLGGALIVSFRGRASH